MSYHDDLDEVKQKRVCHECVGESYLSNDIETTGVVATCAYCGTTDKSWSVEELADSVESAFDDHYRRTSDQPNSWQQTLMSDRKSSYDWYRDGEPVRDAIENAAEISQEVAEDVLAILSDRHLPGSGHPVPEHDLGDVRFGQR